MDIKSNARQIAVQVKALADQLPEQVEDGTLVATASLLARSLSFMKSLIYAVTIPGSRYKRTGELFRGEMMRVKRTSDGAEGEVLTDPSSPAAEYAPFRHESKQHPAPWRALAAQQGANDARDEFTKTVNSNWR